ncbi:MAG: hypothetical protein IPO71_02750 [Nitrosomonas sp.]|nr:hypothetical protein [Nitrosomonas sp.]
MISSGRVFFTITNLSGAVRVTENGLAAFPYKYTTVRLLNVEKVQFSDSTSTLSFTTNHIIFGTNSYSENIPGTAGDDIIDGNGGYDFIDGGAGTDTAVFFGNRSDFNITNLSGAIRVTGLSTAPVEYRGFTVKLVNTEKVEFADLLPTTLANTTNHIIFGTNSYSENIPGTAGNDIIDGNGGYDFIDGGAGSDTAVFFGNSSDFSVTNLNGVVHVTGLNTAPPSYTGYTTQLTNVENIQFIDSIVSTAVDLDFFINTNDPNSEIRVTQGSFLVINGSDLHGSGLDASAIDLGLTAGTSVYSFSSGKVVGAFSGYNDTLSPGLPTTGPKTFGNYVTAEYFFSEIGHPIYVTYAHLTQSTADFWVDAIVAAGGSVSISNKEKIGEVAGDAETPYPVHLHLSFATTYGNYSFPNAIAIASAGNENASLLSMLSIDEQNLSTIKENDYITGTPISTVNVITGKVSNDNLIGTIGIDHIYGLAGNDTLNGAGGADTLIGGLNNDTYIVGNVGDIVIENLNEGADVIRSNVAYTLPANVENLTLTGTSVVNGTGNGQANNITGNNVNNQLNGAGGNDRLLGKGGKDTLTGGAGADKFFLIR